AFVGLIGAFANVREVTPLIAGVAFAAQVGAGFTAELGAMRISDEIDALEVMSVPAFIYLVCTRVTAALLTIIPLYLFALFGSFLATELIVVKFFGLPAGVYNHYFRLFLPPIDIFYSVCKAAIFAVVVALIHCYYGFYAKGGPAGVGVAVGRAIRASIITVVLLNLFLSVLFWGGGNTVKIAG
ncbi:MAG TPA: ABC transporter permease, partial [Acidimicrobiales bacterium]